MFRAIYFGYIYFVVNLFVCPEVRDRPIFLPHSLNFACCIYLLHTPSLGSEASLNAVTHRAVSRLRLLVRTVSPDLSFPRIGFSPGKVCVR